jgi:hypothetical protein
MKKKRLLSNSRDPEIAYQHAIERDAKRISKEIDKSVLDSYKNLPVTSEEEEAWLLLAARDSFPKT